MTDKRQVMYDIERCISHVPDACRDCSHSHYAGTVGLECMEKLMSDALELLKERQPYKVKNIKNVSGWIIGECPSCGSSLHKEFSPNFCGNCGDAIDWSKDGEQE